jgi:hypothetical protein
MLLFECYLKVSHFLLKLLDKEMKAPAGGISTFNIQHGYVEGLVRGYRSGFLDDVDYHHLTQCETLEGIKPYYC